MKTVKFRVTEYIDQPFKQYWPPQKGGNFTAQVKKFGFWRTVKECVNSYCGDSIYEPIPFESLEAILAYLRDKYDAKPERLKLVQMSHKKIYQKSEINFDISE